MLLWDTFCVLYLRIKFWFSSYKYLLKTFYRWNLSNILKLFLAIEPRAAGQVLTFVRHLNSWICEIVVFYKVLDSISVFEWYHWALFIRIHLQKYWFIYWLLIAQILLRVILPQNLPDMFPLPIILHICLFCFTTIPSAISCSGIYLPNKVIFGILLNQIFHFIRFVERVI